MRNKQEQAMDQQEWRARTAQILADTVEELEIIATGGSKAWSARYGHLQYYERSYPGDKFWWFERFKQCGIRYEREGGQVNKILVGICGHCRGRVTIPGIWHSVVPPVPACDSCGRVVATQGLPVLDMELAPEQQYPNHYSRFLVTSCDPQSLTSVCSGGGGAPTVATFLLEGRHFLFEGRQWQ